MADEEAWMAFCNGFRLRRERVNVLFRLVGVAPHLPRDHRRTAVVADLVFLAGSERRVQLLDRRIRLDRSDHVVDRRTKRGICDRSGRALDEHELGLRRPLGKRLLQDLVGRVGLADAGIVQLDLLQADQHVSDVEKDHDAGKPPEDGRLPVRGAPGAHAAGDVHRPLHLRRCEVDRRLAVAAGLLRLILNNARFHPLLLSRLWEQPTSQPRREGDSRGTRSSRAGFLASFRSGETSAPRERGATRCPSTAGRACRRCWRRTSRPPGR